MEKGTQFKINSVEELKEAYNCLKDDWHKSYNLNDEINFFNADKNQRYVICSEGGRIYLSVKYLCFKIVENPLKKTKSQPHYDNSNGSLYKFAQEQNLNAYEFDIIKRVVRCRKKGEFKSDIDKTIKVLELYKQEQNY